MIEYSARSAFFCENFAGAVRFLVESGARNETYVVADPAPVTFAEIIATLRAARGQEARLWNIPPWLLTGALTLAGRSSLAERVGGAEDHGGEGHEAAAGGHAIGEDLKRAHRQLGAAQRTEHAAEAERVKPHA